MAEDYCAHESVLVLVANLLKQAVGQIQHDSLNPNLQPIHQAGLANAAYTLEAAYAGIASAILIHKTVVHKEDVKEGFTPDQNAIGLVTAVNATIAAYFKGDENHEGHDHDHGGEVPPTDGGLLN